MHKKFFFILLNIFFGISSIIFITEIVRGIDFFKKSPYDLERNTYAISAFANMDEAKRLSPEERRIALEELHSLVKDEEIVMIVDNGGDNAGIGIYDPFDKYILNEKQYYRDFINVKNSAIVLKGSTIDKYNSKFLDVSNEIKFEVVNKYDEKNPLMTHFSYQYIYNYFDEPYLYGYYYINTNNEKLIDEILSLFEKKQLYFHLGEIYTVDDDTIYSDTFLSVQFIMFYIAYFTSLIGLLFYYSLTLSSYRKKLKIQYIFGASKGLCYLNLLKKEFVYMCSGNIVGIIIYYLISNNTIFYVKLTDLFLVCFFTIFINIILFTLAYKSKRFSKGVRWRL